MHLHCHSCWGRKFAIDANHGLTDHHGRDVLYGMIACLVRGPARVSFSEMDVTPYARGGFDVTAGAQPGEDPPTKLHDPGEHLEVECPRSLDLREGLVQSRGGRAVLLAEEQGEGGRFEVVSFGFRGVLSQDSSCDRKMSIHPLAQNGIERVPLFRHPQEAADFRLFHIDRHQLPVGFIGDEYVPRPATRWTVSVTRDTALRVLALGLTCLVFQSTRAVGDLLGVGVLTSESKCPCPHGVQNRVDPIHGGELVVQERIRELRQSPQVLCSAHEVQGRHDFVIRQMVD